MHKLHPRRAFLRVPRQSRCYRRKSRSPRHPKPNPEITSAHHLFEHATSQPHPADLSLSSCTAGGQPPAGVRDSRPDGGRGRGAPGSASPARMGEGAGIFRLSEGAAKGHLQDRRQRLVAPPGAPKARQNNTVPRELPTTPLIEDQALSLVSSNRDDPPERETAAPVGAGNGGLETRHRTANPDNEFYPV